MAKITINLNDLKSAVTSYGLLDWQDKPEEFNVDIEIVEANDPGSGAMVDALTIKIEKSEKSYDGQLQSVIKTIEIFPHDSHLDNRLTTQNTTIISKKRKGD